MEILKQLLFITGHGALFGVLAFPTAGCDPVSSEGFEEAALEELEAEELEAEELEAEKASEEELAELAALDAEEAKADAARMDLTASPDSTFAVAPWASRENSAGGEA